MRSSESRGPALKLIPVVSVRLEGALVLRLDTPESAYFGPSTFDTRVMQVPGARPEIEAETLGCRPYDIVSWANRTHST